MTRSKMSRAGAKAGLITALATGLAGTVAQAATSVETLATGLANPRGIAFAPNGQLYVAAAGRGGPGPCIPAAANPALLRCYGETGALLRIRPEGGYDIVLGGLPSLNLPDGTVEGGLVDVAFLGTAAYVQFGLGGDPAVRAGLGGKGGWLGHTFRVTPSGAHQLLTDVSGYESANNPAGGTIDSNPYGILVQPGRRLVADAGANAVLEVGANGSIRTFAVPPPLAGGRQAVTTSVKEGPDGAIYVGLLTGFPFFQGTASVLRYEADGSGVSTRLDGLTAVVDIDFDAGGALYVLEIASGQVPPFPPPNPGIGNGRLKRQCPGEAPTVLLDGLTFASGVAIGPDGAIYLTNRGTSATNGEVLRVTTDPCD